MDEFDRGDPDLQLAGDPDLQVALLRRAVDDGDPRRERCRGCRRTPLVGERIYYDERGSGYCELCRTLEPGRGLECRIVRGPEFGHTMRLIAARARLHLTPDHRAA